MTAAGHRIVRNFINAPIREQIVRDMMIFNWNLNAAGTQLVYNFQVENNDIVIPILAELNQAMSVNQYRSLPGTNDEAKLRYLKRQIVNFITPLRRVAHARLTS